MSKVAIVTGAGQGIGFAIANDWYKMASRSESQTTNAETAEKAVAELSAENALRSLLMSPNKLEMAAASKKLWIISERFKGR